MKFDEITEQSKVYPGEYLLHEPSQQIVLCGAFNRKNNLIRCLVRGNLMEDVIDNFKKIRLTKRENSERKFTKCKGCGKAL
tara:strand:- start:622 stop:864 length:243 start_codon:yes stop_codon:yes gene_type:complete